ncbi:MAG: hypothetical protein JXR22_10585 [Prolixibacteraceae bacterium]|nr:hypothetical protein [Prolixibacteraceae bacterium]
MKTTISSHEKMTYLSLTGSILIFFFYVRYVYLHSVVVNPDIVNDFSFWGRSFIVLIPVAIVVQIVLHIVFAIVNKILTNEDLPAKSDEMVRLIELKSIQLSHWVFVIGFFLAMGSIALNMKPAVMFILLIFSGFMASISSDVAKIYYYRKGL